MTKKQNNMLPSTDMLTFIVLFAIIVVCFLFFVPKVASTLFPFKRQMILQDFLKQSIAAQTISPQAFWQFREFYSPGYYNFNRNGLPLTLIQQDESVTDISLKPGQQTLVFLSFTSPHLRSWEALVEKDSLIDVTTVGNIHRSITMLSNINEIIFKDTKGNIYIVFLKSVSDMQTANGFFDYKGADKSLVMGKYWLDVTMLDGK